MSAKTSVMVLVALLAVPAVAQDCPELEGRWPYGPTFAADGSGGYLYYGSGSVLEVAELSSPGDPQPVGESAPLPGGVFGVAVAGDYAYLANGSGGLRVIDVSDPSAPVEVGFLETTGVFWGIAVSGSYAYVASWYSGLRVIDVSTPSNTPLCRTTMVACGWSISPTPSSHS
jgi:hypothetical protein